MLRTTGRRTPAWSPQYPRVADGQDDRRRGARARGRGRQPAGRHRHGRHHHRALSGGSYVGGELHRRHRATTVARSRPSATWWPTRCATACPPRTGRPTIGVVNPGGLRAELKYAATRRPTREHRRRGHLRRGQRRPAVRQQHLDDRPDRCAVQDGARAAVADEPRWHRRRPGRTWQLGLSDNVRRTRRTPAAGGFADHVGDRRRRAARPGEDLPDVDVLVPRHRRRQLPGVHRRAPTRRHGSGRPRRVDRVSPGPRGPLARLRPPAGGREWSADRCHGG